MAQRNFCPVIRAASFDSDATTANNSPGANRMPGLLFSFLGRKFESTLGKFKARRRHGSDAEGDAIARVRQRSERWLCEIT